MPYFPATVVTSGALTDAAGGAVSRTIAAAGAVYAQANENDERSSEVDAINTLRARIVARIGLRGGGYRPVTPPAKLNCVIGGAVTTTINAAGAVYDRDTENDASRDVAKMVDKVIDDLTVAKGLTGPRGTAFVQLTDNSGGSTAGTFDGDGSLVYNQGNENERRAVLAKKLNDIATAAGV